MASVQRLSQPPNGVDGRLSDEQRSQEPTITMKQHQVEADVSDPASQPSSGALSQSTQADQEEPATPPAPHVFPTTRKDGQIPSGTRPSEALYAGQKRTADGMVPVHHHKSASPERSATLYRPTHARSASTASSTTRNNLGEMGSALRTKLSYAMVKINNGWQDMPLAEVESLSSHAGSPVSSTSTFGRRSLLASPRTAMANYQRRTSDLQRSYGPPASTYEAFWKSHAAVQQQHPSLRGSPPKTNTPSTSASLAPPVDIRPVSRSESNPRRIAERDIKPPLLTTQKLSDLGRPSQPTTPSTPHRGETDTVMRTPGHKSLQEQDAIATLLFMSSPGNSGNMNNNVLRPSEERPLRSPLRSEYRRDERAVGIADSISSQSSVTDASITPRRRGDAFYRSRRRDAFDRQLDNMADDSSDSDDLELIITPRRVAAGSA